MKEILPQMVVGGGVKISFMNPCGGVTNTISISFSDMKMLCLLGGGGADPLSCHYFFSSFMPHFSPPPPKNENMKRYAYAEMPSVRFFCGTVHRHSQVKTFYKVYIVSNFNYTKGQFRTPPSHQKCHCSMSEKRKL